MHNSIPFFCQRSAFMLKACPKQQLFYKPSAPLSMVFTWLTNRASSHPLRYYTANQQWRKDKCFQIPIVLQDTYFKNVQ